MSQDPRRLAFMRVLVAAAWADGELSVQEIRTISHYLQRLRIEGEEAAEVEELLKRRLGVPEATRLLQDQLKVLTSAEEHRTLVAAIEDLLVSDDRLDAQEAAFLRQLRELTRDVPTAQLFVSRLRALWAASPGGRRGEMSAFLQARLLEYFRGRIALARARTGLSVEDGVSDTDLYRAVIWAGLLSEVAQVDESVCPAEQDQLMKLLSVGGAVPRPDLEVIIDIYNEGSLAGLDLGVLVREFLNLVSPDDAGLILDGLFLVAAADGKLQEREINVIRTISKGAGFTEQSFLAAWQRCRRRLSEGWN